MHKLPKTKEFLLLNIETIEEFQNRRKEWVKQNLHAVHDDKEWIIDRLAGINAKNT